MNFIRNLRSHRNTVAVGRSVQRCAQDLNTLLTYTHHGVVVSRVERVFAGPADTIYVQSMEARSAPFLNLTFFLSSYNKKI